MASTDAPVFHAFSHTHFAALAAIAIIGAMLVWLRRSSRDRCALAAERVLAVVLLAFPFGKLAFQIGTGTFDRQSALPFHYCDVAAICGAVALLTRWPPVCEITYFFGMAGTLQALITPALETDFPHARYWLFFGEHGAVVIAALHVVLGLRQPPQPGGVRRAMLATLVYAAAAGSLDLLLAANYGFLCAKPPTASLLDSLGPWPWYLGALLFVALAFYLVLDLPFALRRRRGVARD